ncbi:MAG: FAD-binding protein [Gammaproteobacteria bacterium]|nr:FAD-binding protein [Gammaproteobacteria bacterium]
MTRSPHVIVVGGGIGGLAAALGLLRQGQRVTLLEQVASLGEVGAGLSITPNAGKALDFLGLGDVISRIGSTPPAGQIRHFQTGATLVNLPQDQSREKYGKPLYHVHRADLHAALADAVAALDSRCLHTGCEVRHIDSRPDGVRVTLADGSSIDADWLVGADGIHSRVRAELMGADRPNFTGYVAWRGLIPGEIVDPALLDPPLCMTVGPRRMLMRYPLRRGAVVNFVAIARRSDFETHTLRLLALTPVDRLFKWGLFDRDPLPSWTRGRATLLGDAAHAMPPFTGQGAVMALEDAAILGRAAAATTDIDELLRRYEAARLPRVTAALAMSRARAELYFADDPMQQVRALGAGMAELRTLYDYDAATVPV